jgi:hypothetical protein
VLLPGSWNAKYSVGFFFLYTDLGVRVLSVDPQEIDGHIDIRHERTCVIRHFGKLDPRGE